MPKVGDVYFENEILKVTYVNGYCPGYFMYEMDFLGHISKYSCAKEHIDKTIKKRQDAYDLIPIGCKVIPCNLIKLFNGLFVGGIMEDSIKRVYGISSNGIRGFSCSVFFMPNQEHLDSIMKYENIIGEFKIR